MARVVRLREQQAVLANRIHATLLNQIAAVVAQSQVCESAIGSGDGRSADEVSRLRDMLRTLEEAARKLFETTIDAGGATLAEALQAEVEAFQRKHSEIRIECRLDDVGIIRARWLTRVIVDIVHEAMVNAARHGRPSQLDLVATRAAGGILLRVRDNGRGFDLRSTERSTPGALGHYGIHIMQESAKSANCRVEISSAPGKGTQVSLFVPVA